MPSNAPTRYAAVFGRNPALSIAELSAVGAAHGFSVAPLGKYAAALDGFDLALADRFGAVTKVVELLGTAASTNAALERLADSVPEMPTGKLIFGISSYGSPSSTELTNKMRELLSRRGVKHRYMAKRLGKSGRPSDGELSAVQVKHNKLLTKGHDWCLFEADGEWHYGRTVWIYDFEGFAKRDYDKPRSDSRRGMLPPQLARTMVNLATGGDSAQSVCDPFCGSGNLLLESSDLGHRTFGSDISEKAVEDSRKNLEWLGTDNWDVTVRDATTTLPDDPVDAIVTEGYLGQLVNPNTTDQTLEVEAKQVEALQLKFFEQAKPVLKPGSRLVITWPIWKLSHSQLELPLVDQVKALGYTVVRPVPPAFRPTELTKRDSIAVSRPNQRVIHELFIFERT